MLSFCVQLAEHLRRAPAQLRHAAEFVGEVVDRAARRRHQDLDAFRPIEPGRIAVFGQIVACGAFRSRAADDSAPRPAARGASGCRAGRPADRDCGARPRCRRALRTACAPSGRCGARCAGRRARPRLHRRAAASRFRDRKTTCSYREFRAGAVRDRAPQRRRRHSDRRLGVRSCSTVRWAGAFAKEGAMPDDARGGANFRGRLVFEKAAGHRAIERISGLMSRAAPSRCQESAPRSRMTRMPLGRGMRLAGDMRQKIDPRLPLHLPILIRKGNSNPSRKSPFAVTSAPKGHLPAGFRRISVNFCMCYRRPAGR